MKPLVIFLALVGCDRALPYTDTDAGTVVMTDATRSDLAQAPVPDLAEPDLALCESASTCGCVDATNATCFAEPGSNGCVPGWCRGR